VTPLGAQVTPDRFYHLLYIEGRSGEERLEELKVEAEVRIAQMIPSTLGSPALRFSLGHWQAALDQVEVLESVQLKVNAGGSDERLFADFCQGMRAVPLLSRLPVKGWLSTS
jgi:hypothetical protein